MPVGNLRTAANDERDDDPRALRPIPIATKDVVSFVEKNNPPGQNAEVVRRLLMFSLFFPNVSIWSSSSLSNDVDDDESVYTSSARARQKSPLLKRRLWVLALRRLSLLLSLRKEMRVLVSWFDFFNFPFANDWAVVSSFECV